MEITKFFETMYVDASSYDNIRKIASYIDGLKNSGRKVIYTVLDKKINSEVKVSRLKSTVSEHTEYLHGEDNLSGVIVTMARNYVGANNLPLLKAEGSFGNRYINKASADRYIFTAAQPYLNKIFDPRDFDVLIHQTFEGNKIEPRFFVPIIPLVLVNGSNGVSYGFAQNVLPRKFKDIKKAVEKYLKTGEIKIPNPGWEGFKGKVKKIGDNKWEVHGVMKREGSTIVKITEIPIGIELKKYLAILDDLKESKIISSYEDNSEDDKFDFKIRLTREAAKLPDEELMKKLGLVKTSRDFSENLTFIDENNRIVEFDTPEEVFKAYIDIREEWYRRRKEHLLKKYNEELKYMFSKFLFIKGYIQGDIKINNVKKSDIESQLEKVEKIIKRDGNYDYLLRMPVYSLTKEKIEQLKKEIVDKKEEIKALEAKSEKDLWLEDLANL